MSEIPASCQPFDEDFSALLDGELSERREAELRAHLADCGGCARRLERLRAVDRVLAGLPAPAVPPALARRLSERLEARRPPARRAARWLGGWAGAALAAAAALTLALWLSLRGERSSAPELARSAPPAEQRAPAPRPAPTPAASQLADRPAPEPQPVAVEGLEPLPEEDLALLLMLDEVEDLDVLANLELLETLVELEPSGGAG